MTPHKHSHIFREKDVDRIIARYGKKPPEQVRDQIRAKLEAQRGKFRALEQIRSQNRGQKQGRDM